MSIVDEILRPSESLGGEIGSESSFGRALK